ncbi:MAG: alpha/beta fold hydrolase [Actinobacteria bacterium]|nr:alpha/beta fold hydrolase [Actinomycetota bacterium]
MEIDLAQLTLSALTWGPDDGPLALCLHGFPDTAHTWRHLGPQLGEAGWRVVAPFTRGYAPSGLPRDGSYHVAALVADAVELHAALGGDERAVVVGHDWGAITANGLGALPSSPYRRVVSMAVPPIPALSAPRPDVLAFVALLPRQLRMSWYTLFNQLPVLPERHFDRLVRHLWAAWSPGFDAREDLAHVAAALPDRARVAAAVGYYRAASRQWRLPERYADFQECWTASPIVPTLYLYGEQDGCLNPGFGPRVLRSLPPGSEVVAVPDAGHFLQVERPEVVGQHVVRFLEMS